MVAVEGTDITGLIGPVATLTVESGNVCVCGGVVVVVGGVTVVVGLVGDGDIISVSFLSSFRDRKSVV